MTTNQKLGIAAILLFLWWKSKTSNGGSSDVTITPDGSPPINTSTSYLGTGMYTMKMDNTPDAILVINNKPQFDQMIADGWRVAAFTAA